MKFIPAVEHKNHKRRESSELAVNKEENRGKQYLFQEVKNRRWVMKIIKP